jgi:hypothetical protein
VLLTEVNQLLDHPYLPLETGWLRLDDGQALVAGRTQMVGCKGKMIEWWFGFVHHTEEYLWWHPRDHLFSDWDGERGTGQYIGGAHLVREYIGDDIYSLRIQWHEPSEFFDVSRFPAANVSAAICGRIGDLDSPQDKQVWLGRLIHLVQDTPDGCVMRSRFWLGDLDGIDGPITPETRQAIATDKLAIGLLQHCCEEMSLLASFLPKLYELYHRPVEEGNKEARPFGSVNAAATGS